MSLWTPANLTGVHGWYSTAAMTGADNSIVQTFVDLSGNGRSLDAWNAAKPRLRTSASFLLNGLPTLEFSAALCAMRYDAGTEFDVSGLYITAVHRVTSAVSNARTLDVSGRTSHTAQCVGFSQGGVIVSSATTSWVVVANSRSGVVKSQYFLLAGDLQHTGVSPFPVRTPAWPTTSAFALRGGVAELLICSLPSLNDQQRIEGYLHWTWGLQANLPSDHPYKNSAPTTGSQSRRRRSQRGAFAL